MRSRSCRPGPLRRARRRLDPMSAAPNEPNIALVDAPAMWAAGSPARASSSPTWTPVSTSLTRTSPAAGAAATNPGSIPYGQHPACHRSVGARHRHHGRDRRRRRRRPRSAWRPGDLDRREDLQRQSAAPPRPRSTPPSSGCSTRTATLPRRTLQGRQQLVVIRPPGCNLAFQPDLQALLRGGIVPVFAAGNYGPAAPPREPHQLPGGARRGRRQVRRHHRRASSRGPSACGEACTTYRRSSPPG